MVAFNVGNWLITHELEQMDRYIDLLNAAIGDNQKQLEASIEEVAKTMTESEKSEFYEFNEDDFAEASQDFPRLLFSSFVVSWYSFIEIHLMDFCKSHKLKISITIQDNENYGEGIRRAYNFLSRAAGYKINNEHWQELIRAGKTRNKIVHNNGKVSFSFDEDNSSVPVTYGDNTIYLKLENDLYKYFEKHKLLETRGIFYVTPKFDYCKHLVKFGHEFFGNLYKDFEEKA